MDFDSMFYGRVCKKTWNCPSDRHLRLRSKIGAGWSVHTENLFWRKDPISSSELRVIENVIRRASRLEQMEVERIKRLVFRLENMSGHALGDGKQTCFLCGMRLARLGRASVNCEDCNKAVCDKCRVDTVDVFREAALVLCKICAEGREVWKKSGGWFYGRVPVLSEDTEKESDNTSEGSPMPVRSFGTWEHRIPDIVRMESFEPPEANHRSSLYKHWAPHSTADLNKKQNVELEDLNFKQMGHAMQPPLSASCPALNEANQAPRLSRRSAVRRKRPFLSP